MNDLALASLGETWLQLVQRTVQAGVPLKGEGIELLEAKVVFAANSESDPLISRFGDPRMIAEMDKVFFAEGANALGHSYADLMRGPDGKHDLTDIISLLRAEPATKRAVLTFCGKGNGKVPCINLIEFLIRDSALRTIYFARGQDAYKKFYADALCIAKMARRIAEAVGVPPGFITGFIASSHIYHEDRPAIDDFIARGMQFLTANPRKGGS
jgi:thymidylate synthase